MKIAIYGDSFGNYVLENIPGDTLNRGLAWVEILAEKYTVTNFSQSASSLFYSYELFLKHNKDFDYNIFLVTETNRLTLSNVDNDYHLKHINLSIIESFKKNAEQAYIELDKKITAAAFEYYKYIHNQKYVDTCHQLMVDNIRTISQNTLIIPCFSSSIPGKVSLSNINAVSRSKKEQILMSKGYLPWKLIDNSWIFVDYRKCHLSEENNIILANNIEDNLINKRFDIMNINISDYRQETKDIEFYWFIKKLTDNGFKDLRFSGELNNLLIDTN